MIQPRWSIYVYWINKAFGKMVYHATLILTSKLIYLWIKFKKKNYMTIIGFNPKIYKPYLTMNLK